jgi:hypothetical protein
VVIFSKIIKESKKKNMTYTPLILIGEAKNCFDDKYSLTKKEIFKYLMVAQNGKQLQMLLTVKDKPYELHAQALLSHMEDNKLSEIIVHGGGLINFGQYQYMEFVSLINSSYAFDGVAIPEVTSFLMSVWSSIKEIDVGDAIPVNPKNISKYHRLYTLDEVIKEANKGNQK